LIEEKKKQLKNKKVRKGRGRSRSFITKKNPMLANKFLKKKSSKELSFDPKHIEVIAQ
jgi:hypothetical protein